MTFTVDNQDTPRPWPLLRVAMVLLVLYMLATLVLSTVIYRFYTVVTRSKPQRRTRPAHAMIVLGSGGHTAEMFAILEALGSEYVTKRFGRRSWVVSSGDGFSAARARKFEETIGGQDYEIVTVRRARKVHQPLWTTPWSALLCLWDCVGLVRTGPDLILTNGPGTGVVVVLASLCVMVLGLGGEGAMRSVYLESWARVRTLSLSGKLLRFMVNRFLVQWKTIADVDATRLESEGVDSGGGLGRRREYIGAIVA